MERIVWTLMVVILAGCSGGGSADRGPTPPAPADAIASPALDPAALNENQQRQQQVALAARDELFQALSGRLMDVLGEAGPAAAISVCKSDAPRLAGEVGAKHGVAIARTSHRLRNPKNAPPDWARPLVDRQVQEAVYVKLPEAALGALLPIRLKSDCLFCHGPREQILVEVQAALAQEYPQDQATGFAAGELRGWFWVEVPAGVRPVPAGEPASTSAS